MNVLYRCHTGYGLFALLRHTHMTHRGIIFGNWVEDGGRMHSLSFMEVISMPAPARTAVVQ